MTAFGNDANPYGAAAGHFGNKSPLLVRHYAEDLGFEYMTASDKESFKEVLPHFLTTEKNDKPMLFEVFANNKDESDALKMMNNIIADKPKSSPLKTAVKKVLGQEVVNAIRKVVKG